VEKGKRRCNISFSNTLNRLGQDKVLQEVLGDREKRSAVYIRWMGLADGQTNKEADRW